MHRSFVLLARRDNRLLGAPRVRSIRRCQARSEAVPLQRASRIRPASRTCSFWRSGRRYARGSVRVQTTLEERGPGGAGPSPRRSRRDHGRVRGQPRHALALWRKTFRQKAFLKRNVQGELIGRFLNPIHWGGNRLAEGVRASPTSTTTSCSTARRSTTCRRLAVLIAASATRLGTGRLRRSSTSSARSWPDPPVAGAAGRRRCRSVAGDDQQLGGTCGYQCRRGQPNSSMHPSRAGQPGPTGSTRCKVKAATSVPSSRRRRRLDNVGLRGVSISPDVRIAARGRPADADRPGEAIVRTAVDARTH